MWSLHLSAQIVTCCSVLRLIAYNCDFVGRVKQEWKVIRVSIGYCEKFCAGCNIRVDSIDEICKIVHCSRGAWCDWGLGSCIGLS